MDGGLDVRARVVNFLGLTKLTCRYSRYHRDPHRWSSLSRSIRLVGTSPGAAARARRGVVRTVVDASAAHERHCLDAS